MSANTSITEGGKPRPFGPVVALMVQGDDGKYYSWYPEPDRALGTLSVDKNGIYRASDKGVYGWSRVSVNVPQNEGVSGKDPDTGEDVYVHPDPETGELVTDVLPVEIRVIEPPTNPYGTYVDGQTIAKDGMVVKGYLKDGSEWGTIPNAEITLNPTTADFSQTHGDRISTSDEFPHSMWPSTVNSLKSFASTTNRNTGKPYATYSGPCFFAFRRDGNSTVGAIACSDRPGSYTKTLTNKNPKSYGLGASFTYNGKTVYYDSGIVDTFEVPSGGINQHQSGASAYGANYAAWTIIYGDVTQEGNEQTITVSWPRPGDGAVLETTFDILVGPHGGTGDD